MTESNVTSHDDQFDDDDLVGYLDGELDGATAQRLEQRLATDPEYRTRLRRLQSSWDLLDDLPRVEVNPTFAQSTVSMVAVRASDDARRTSSRPRVMLKWGLGIAGALLTSAAGYYTVDAVNSASDRQLIRDLPVIERIDMYQAAEDTEFLRRLIREGLFHEETKDAP